MERLFTCTRWGLDALACGFWPSQPPDRETWTGEDTFRLEKAGTRLGFRAACLYIMSDWEAVSSYLGCPTWSSNTCPCPLCPALKSNWHEYSDCPDFRYCEHPTNAHKDACERNEVWITVNTLEERDMLVAQGGFAFDRRKTGGRGLVITADLGALNSESAALKAGDCLRSQDSLPDIALYGSMVPPKRLCFWRKCPGSIINVRNPIFGSEIGVTISGSLAVDWLHTGPLGVLSFVVLECVWRAVRSPEIGGRSDFEARCSQAWGGQTQEPTKVTHPRVIRSQRYSRGPE